MFHLSLSNLERIECALSLHLSTLFSSVPVSRTFLRRCWHGRISRVLDGLPHPNGRVGMVCSAVRTRA